MPDYYHAAGPRDELTPLGKFAALVALVAILAILANLFFILTMNPPTEPAVDEPYFPEGVRRFHLPAEAGQPGLDCVGYELGGVWCRREGDSREEP